MPARLIGHVSDEHYVAIPDCLVELDRDGACVALVLTTSRGEVFGDVPDGTYRVTLACRGFGSKSVALSAAPYRVIRPEHWVFDGTGLATGDVFGTEGLQERCHGGASGHETRQDEPALTP